MTAQPPPRSDLDRIFGPEERSSEDRTGRDEVRVLEARIRQLERQQQIFEEEHQRIVAQLLATSDALMTEQQTALARLDQEVADRNRSWRERILLLEQARAASEAQGLKTQQRLLNLAYAIERQMRVVLEAAGVADRGAHAEEARAALESIRSSAAAVLRILEACGGRDARGATGGDACDAARPPFDLDVALARAGGDTALLKELAASFLVDGPKRLLEAKAALDRRDGTTLSREAHTLKGTAGLFGAAAVSRAASDLERLGRDGHLDQAERVYPVLEAALGRLRHALTEFAEDVSRGPNATDNPT